MSASPFARFLKALLFAVVANAAAEHANLSSLDRVIQADGLRLSTRAPSPSTATAVSFDELPVELKTLVYDNLGRRGIGSLSATSRDNFAASSLSDHITDEKMKWQRERDAKELALLLQQKVRDLSKRDAIVNLDEGET